MENQSWVLANISGAQQLADWFGRFPTFHDAEILELHLSRSGISWLKIHTWKMSAVINSSNEYINEKDVVVTIKLRDVSDIDLSGFNHQNVIFSLQISPVDDGIKLELEPCFGMAGKIIAAQIEIEIEPFSSEVVPQN